MSTDPLFEALERAREGLPAIVEADQRAAQHARFVAAARQERRPARRLWVAAMATAAVLAVSVGLGRRGPAPSAVLDGVELATGAWVDAAARERTVRFEDATELTVSSGSRVRLAVLERDRVQADLDSGEVRLKVTKRPERRLELRCGPYTVAVKGTTFVTKWDGPTARLQVEVIEGRVEVLGGHLGARVFAVGSGERLTATPAGIEIAPPTAPEPEIVKAPEAPVEEDVDRSPVGKTPRWVRLAQNADFRDAWEEASRSGIDRLGKTLPGSRLLLLADVGRLSDHPAEARALLELVRTRFRTDAVASKAAFRLGRLAYDERHFPEALSWFERCVQETKDADLASEARGRVIELLVREGRREEARVVARTYLDRHADGPYAPLARQVLEQ